MGPWGIGLEVNGSCSRPLVAMAPVDRFALVAMFTIACSILVRCEEWKESSWRVPGYRVSVGVSWRRVSRLGS